MENIYWSKEKRLLKTDQGQTYRIINWTETPFGNHLVQVSVTLQVYDKETTEDCEVNKTYDIKNIDQFLEGMKRAEEVDRILSKEDKKYLKHKSKRSLIKKLISYIWK